MKALVTGGTGTLGRLVVPRLQDAGCEVRVLSRRSRAAGQGIEFVTGDLATGQGVDAAVVGAEVIVHCAGTKKGDEDKARHLVRAARRAGTRHLVYISVVGADRIPVASGVDRALFGYFAAKLAAERVVADSGLPWTALRATQFHDGILMTVRQLARMPVIPVPAGWRFQPVDTGKWRTGSWNSRRTPRPASCPTWVARACTRCPRCYAGTCRPLAGIGPSCRSGSPATPLAPFALARTWLRTGPLATGRGRISWLRG